MNLEDKVNNKEIKYVLQQIKYQLLVTPKNELITFEVGPDWEGSILLSGRVENILYKLQEWKAIKIEEITGLSPTQSIFYLKVLQPKFDEVYKQYVEHHYLRGRCLTFYTIHNTKLQFNKETGDFVFGRVKNKLNQGTQEFRVFLKLLENKSHQAKYETLLQEMYPKERIEKRNMKVYKMNLALVIRNIKEKLGILPREKRKNKEIFKNLKKWGGYRLLLK